METVANILEKQLPRHDQIAARAYQIYLERGGQAGHEQDDWLQAEYELTQLPIRKIAELDPFQPQEKMSLNKTRIRRSALVGLVHVAVLLGSAFLSS